LHADGAQADKQKADTSQINRERVEQWNCEMTGADIVAMRLFQKSTCSRSNSPVN
jgi:hypothetical protein